MPLLAWRIINKTISTKDNLLCRGVVPFSNIYILKFLIYIVLCWLLLKKNLLIILKLDDKFKVFH